MIRTWVASDADPTNLARRLEAHLNEFAERVISVSYTIRQQHHVLAVYCELETAGTPGEERAVAVAEEIIDQASP